MRYLAALVSLCLALSGCGRPAVVAPPLTSGPTPSAAPSSTPAIAPSSEGALDPGSPVEDPVPFGATPPVADSVAEQRSPLGWDDWNTYAAALRPEAASQLDLKGGLTQYHLDLQLSPDLTKLNGQARIRYTNRENVPLDTIYLHLFPNLWDGGMTVSGVEVAGRPVTVTWPSQDILGLPLQEPLATGDTVDLSLDFEMAIPSGEGVGNYGEFAYQDGVLAMAHFYPTVVVYDEGGWRLETPSSQGDVIYHDASLYDVRLTAPEDLVVVGTGAAPGPLGAAGAGGAGLGRQENGDGTATWRLAGGPMRDFNIVASRQYRSESRTVSPPTGKGVGDVTVNSYFLPKHEAGGKKALEWAARALDTYENAFGPYPYRELNVIETATTAGGIEYPGMIVVASRLYDDPERQTFFESATAHEVAHQWWYNVVGNDQLNNPWLDEALAQYGTYLYYRDAYGEAGGEGFTDAMKERWARVDYAKKPIGLPVEAYEGKEYGALVYGRGPLFLLALQEQIGEEKMKAFLQQYYTEQAWDIATPAEFQSLAEKVSGQDLDALFAEWVYPVP